MIEYKAFKFVEVAGASDEGVIKGVLSPYNNVDLGNDVVKPGAFTKTLGEQRGRVPALWQHDWHSPIGVNYLSDGPKGLETELRLNLDKQLAKEALSDVKFWKEHGLSFGLSIGYETINATTNKNGVRELTELKLFEGSLVTFPMNESARVTGAKDLADILADVKAGRVVSAANRVRLSRIVEEISALLAADADEEAAKSQNEPAEPLVEQFKSLLELSKWN